jgi:hypothetical protein
VCLGKLTVTRPLFYETLQRQMRVCPAGNREDIPDIEKWCLNIDQHHTINILIDHFETIWRTTNEYIDIGVSLTPMNGLRHSPDMNQLYMEA